MTAYNLTIEDTQTYFVAANLDAEPVWVHNCPNPHGRRGSPQTRLEIEAIGQDLESHGYKITGGDDNLKEEYIPGPNGSRRGSSYVDVTAKHPSMGTVRIDHVDVRADGFPTPRELRNAIRIGNDRNCFVCLVPKGPR